MPKPPSEYVQHVLELLQPLGEVRAKAMFGGWGLYQGAVFFGVIAEDQVYFRADEVNRPDFEAVRSKPWFFEPTQITTSYYAPPDTALDDARELSRWARSGVEAAQRHKAASAKKPRPTRSRTIKSTKHSKK